MGCAGATTFRGASGGVSPCAWAGRRPPCAPGSGATGCPAGDGARGRSRLSMATEPAHFWQLKTAQGRTSRAARATGGSREAAVPTLRPVGAVCMQAYRLGLHGQPRPDDHEESSGPRWRSAGESWPPTRQEFESTSTPATASEPPPSPRSTGRSASSGSFDLAPSNSTGRDDPPRAPPACQVGRLGLHAQSSHPPPERVNSNPLRTPAAAGGADAAPGRTWNGGPASIPRP